MRKNPNLRNIITLMRNSPKLIDLLSDVIIDMWKTPKVKKEYLGIRINSHRAYQIILINMMRANPNVRDFINFMRKYPKLTYLIIFMRKIMLFLWKNLENLIGAIFIGTIFLFFLPLPTWLHDKILLFFYFVFFYGLCWVFIFQAITFRLNTRHKVIAAIIIGVTAIGIWNRYYY